MKFERRLPPKHSGTEDTSSDLPVDYLRLVEATVTEALTPGLTQIRMKYPDVRFAANGALYIDEVLLALTLSLGPTEISATTVYASTAFNSSLEKPKLEDCLAACLDGAFSVFDFFLDPSQAERIEDFVYAPLSAQEDAPFEWTKAKEMKLPVWVKMDKTNPLLESLTDKWLRENDPHFAQDQSVKEVRTSVESAEFLEERLQTLKSKNNNSGGLH